MLTKEYTIFDHSKIKINDLLFVKNKETGEWKKGLVSVVSYHFIQLSFVVEDERTVIGLEGMIETFDHFFGRRKFPLNL